MSPDDGPTARYRFGPLERRGLVAGWRGGQIGAVAVGLMMAVVTLRASSSPVGVAVAVAAVAVAVGAATWPIGGRTAEEWAPDAMRHAAVLTGRRRPVRRSVFDALRVVPLEVDGLGSVGVLHDQLRGTYTAVVGVSAPGFVLLGEQDKVRRVDEWSGVLAALARDRSTVHRLQWIERVVLTPPRTVTPGTAIHTEAQASYEALLSAEAGASWRHEVHLGVTVRAARSGWTRAETRVDEATCASLLREVAALRRRLADASLDVSTVLAPDAVVALLRDTLDPGPSPVGPTSAPARSSPDPVGPLPSPVGGDEWPWPMAVEVAWGRVHADGTWHATFWVSEWPRIDVGPDFLAPFLLPSAVRRTVSVVMEPLGPVEAARKIEKARTADIADAEIRRRGGFLATARRRREEEVLARRELELADGHAHYRFTGYVTVSAADLDGLDEAVATVEQSAARAGIELRRCYGAQLESLLCALPLGRGLL